MLLSTVLEGKLTSLALESPSIRVLPVVGPHERSVDFAIPGILFTIGIGASGHRNNSATGLRTGNSRPTVPHGAIAEAGGGLPDITSFAREIGGHTIGGRNAAEVLRRLPLRKSRARVRSKLGNANCLAASAGVWWVYGRLVSSRVLPPAGFRTFVRTWEDA
jgi:hypothetical protein